MKVTIELNPKDSYDLEILERIFQKDSGDGSCAEISLANICPSFNAQGEYDKKIIDIKDIKKEISVRTYNGLRNIDVFYLNHLEFITESYLFRMPNFGRKSLQETKDICQKYSMVLGRYSEVSVPEVLTKKPCINIEHIGESQ